MIRSMEDQFIHVRYHPYNMLQIFKNIDKRPQQKLIEIENKTQSCEDPNSKFIEK